MRITNKQLLQLLVTIIDTELLKAVCLKNLKSINIQYSDKQVLIGAFGHFDGFIDARHNPCEESVVHSLCECVAGVLRIRYIVFFADEFASCAEHSANQGGFQGRLRNA